MAQAFVAEALAQGRRAAANVQNTRLGRQKRPHVAGERRPVIVPFVYPVLETATLIGLRER